MKTGLSSCPIVGVTSPQKVSKFSDERAKWKGRSVYALYSEDKIYIGKTESPNSRLSGHRSSMCTSERKVYKALKDNPEKFFFGRIYKGVDCSEKEKKILRGQKKT